MAVQEIADQFGVHRSTLWHWRKLEIFQAYLNALRVEAKRHAVNGVLSLQADASVGLTDAHEMIRLSCMDDPLTELLELGDSVLDEETYRRRCEELNIDP